MCHFLQTLIMQLLYMTDCYILSELNIVQQIIIQDKIYRFVGVSHVLKFNNANKVV